MNHTYRLIWSKCASAFVVVSELATACGRSGGSKRVAAPATAAAAASARTTPALAPRALLLAVLSCFQINAAFAHTDSLGWVITPDTNTPGTSDVTIFYGTWHNTNVAAEGSLNLTGPNGFAANSAFAVVPGYINRPNGTLPAGLVLGTNYFFPNTATPASDFTSVAGSHSIYGFQSASFTGLGSGLYQFGYAAGALTVNWQPSDPAINAGSFTINGDGSISVIGAPVVVPVVPVIPLLPVVPVVPVIPVHTVIDQTHGNLAASVHDLSSNPYAQASLSFDGGTLQYGADTLTAKAALLSANGGTIDTNGHDVAVSGDISGSGGFSKSGAGNLTLGGVLSQAGSVTVAAGSLVLGGANTYAGGTVVAGGASVSVARDENLGAAGSGIALQGGALHVTASFSTARDIALNGGGLIHADGGAILTSAGGVSGSGALVKSGDGAVVLSGVLSHGGGTTVNAGVLSLTGANTYTGNTTVNGGVLQVAGNASLGNPANAITLNGGTLQTTATFATDRAISMTADSQLVADAGTVLTSTGTVSGSGRLFKAGAGTLVLNGDNIGWSGGTTIDGGLVQVNSPTGIGTGQVILNGGMINPTVTLTTGQTINVGGNVGVNTNADTTTTLTGAMQTLDGAADGCFIKSGGGTLNMQGTAVLRNGTCVEDGMLRANGLLTSMVRVDLPGTLRGAGLIVGDTMVFGRLAPGNSPGTLTSQGSVTMMPGSTFQADINGTGTGTGPGNYSRLILTGATSQYTAGGATLAPNLTAITGADVYTPYVPQVGERYRIVSAEGGIVGRFAPLVQPDGLAAGTRMAVFYDAFGSNSIDLAILPASYAATAGNRNAQSAGAALDRNLAADQAGSATAAQGKLAYLLAGLQASQVASTVAALSGEIHGALAAAAPLAGQSLDKAVSGQLGSVALYGSPDLAPKEALWADLVGARAHWRADGAASGMQARELQLTIGADLLRAEASRFGVGLSHAETNVSTAGGSGAVDHDLVFAYGRQALGMAVIDGMVGAGRSHWDSQRGDPLGMTPQLKTATHGNDTLAAVGVSLPWTVGTAVVAPFARVLWQKNRRAAIDEGSDSLAALTLGGHAASGSRVMAGVSGGSLMRDPLQAQLTYRYGAAIGRDGGEAVRPGVDAQLAGTAMRIEAPQNGRGFVRLNASLTALLGKNAYAYAGLDGEGRSGRTEAGINLGARIAF